MGALLLYTVWYIIQYNYYSWQTQYNNTNWQNICIYAELSLTHIQYTQMYIKMKQILQLSLLKNDRINTKMAWNECGADGHYWLPALLYLYSIMHRSTHVFAGVKHLDEEPHEGIRDPCWLICVSKHITSTCLMQPSPPLAPIPSYSYYQPKTPWPYSILYSSVTVASICLIIQFMLHLI